MKRHAVVFLILGLLPALQARAADAAAVADQVMEALGGKAAWDNTRFLRFDFAVEVKGKTVSSRSHWWDKWTGRYRVEGKTKEGQAYVVLMNLNTRDGAAWLDGKPLAGDEKKKYLEKGNAVWVNDTYWLLMPYKMKDPGVVLTDEGVVKEQAATFEKLCLTFQEVGLTPKDRYWVYVNAETHLVQRWEYVLQGEKPPPTRWEWSSWKRYGKVMLATDRTNAKEQERIFFPALAAPDNIPDSVFASPDRGAG